MLWRTRTRAPRHACPSATLCPAYPKEATNTHEQSTALHMQHCDMHCAHNTQARALHRHVGGSSTRASPANAPAERHLHAHSDVQQHARPSLPCSTPIDLPFLAVEQQQHQLLLLEQLHAEKSGRRRRGRARRREQVSRRPRARTSRSRGSARPAICHAPSSERARSNKLCATHKTSARATFPNPPRSILILTILSY